MKPLFSKRVSIGLLVTLGWAATMAAVWRSENVRGGHSLRAMGMTPEELLVTWRDYGHVMWIMREGRRIGAASMEIKRIEQMRNDVTTSLGYLLTSRTHARFAVGGFLPVEVPIEIDLAVAMGNDFELDEIQASIEAAGQTIQVGGFAEGEQLFYRVQVNGGVSTATETAPGAMPAPAPAAHSTPGILKPSDLCGSFKLPGPIILSSVIDSIVTSRSEDFVAGHTWSTQAVNPLLGSRDVEMQVTVEALDTIVSDGKPVKAWRLRERAANMQTLSWYDRDGRLLRSEFPGDIALERTSESAVRGTYPQFGKPVEFEPLDKVWIRNHQDPAMQNRRIEDVLPMGPIF